MNYEYARSISAVLNKVAVARDEAQAAAFDIQHLVSLRDMGFVAPGGSQQLARARRSLKRCTKALSERELELAQVQHGLDTGAPVLSGGAL